MPRVRNKRSGRIFDVPAGHFSLRNPQDYEQLPERKQPKGKPQKQAPEPEADEQPSEATEPEAAQSEQPSDGESEPEKPKRQKSK